jgi:hypothetical protein
VTRAWRPTSRQNPPADLVDQRAPSARPAKYMVPSAFVVLERCPTASSKVIASAAAPIRNR